MFYGKLKIWDTKLLDEYTGKCDCKYVKHDGKVVAKNVNFTYM